MECTPKQEVEWDDEYEALPPRLQHYGKILSKRFMDKEKSKLYQVQKDALESVVNWFSSPEKRDYTSVVVMPTGAGKSGVICCLPYAIGGAIAEGKIESNQIAINKPFLIITPSLAIRDQLKNDLSQIGFLRSRGLLTKKDISKSAHCTVFMVDKNTNKADLDAYNCDIVLSNSQKWRKSKDDTPTYEDLDEDLFSMVIVDEAHHVPAPQWEEIVNKFRNHAKIVFFTATPKRADGREITTDGAINMKGYTYELSQDEATKLRLIRKVKFFDEVYENALPPEKRIKLAIMAQKKSEERLFYAKSVVKKVKETLTAKNDTQKLPGDQKHAAIIITKNIREAEGVEELSKEFFEEEKVKIIHSEKFKGRLEQRNEAIGEIKKGKYDVIIIVQMLLEGFDYPPLSVAGIVTPIRSPVKFAQFVGRIRRLVRHTDQITGKTTCEDEAVMADIITHKYFEQWEKYDEYCNPKIADKENKQLDEDEEENSQARLEGSSIEEAEA